MGRSVYIGFAWLFMILALFAFLVGDFKFLVFCGFAANVISNFSRQ